MNTPALCLNRFGLMMRTIDTNSRLGMRYASHEVYAYDFARGLICRFLVPDGCVYITQRIDGYGSKPLPNW